jgi:hypothetical protein
VVSKAKVRELVRDFRYDEKLDQAFDEKPALLGVRDERGRNWLHLCCARTLEDGRTAEASIRTADLLLGRGLGLDDPAFTEGAFRATPLWFAIAWGRNLELATHLLGQGAYPDNCLFAAAWNNDRAAIRLLIGHGTRVDDDSSPGETPLLGAVKWSRFGPAEELFEAGADPNFRDPSGMTALHYMLKKGSDKAHFALFARFGARGDIPDGQGRTAAAIMRRKRDPEFHRLADALAEGG